jgi:entericidin B
MTSFIRILALTAVLIGLGGCNTVAGIGKDIQRGGQKIEDAGRR